MGEGPGERAAFPTPIVTPSMPTQLTTVKSRLGIAAADITNDVLLTRVIEAFSTRFDRECNRILARTQNNIQEFSADEIEIPAICYPIESITRFEVRTTIRSRPPFGEQPPTRLPADLEQAAIEQVAYWFRNKEKTGLLRSWPHDGTFEVFPQSDLLTEVRAVLKKYERLLI